MVEGSFTQDDATHLLLPNGLRLTCGWISILGTYSVSPFFLKEMVKAL